jgi:hypothetical protein
MKGLPAGHNDLDTDSLPQRKYDVQINTPVGCGSLQFPAAGNDGFTGIIAVDAGVGIPFRRTPAPGWGLTTALSDLTPTLSVYGEGVIRKGGFHGCGLRVKSSAFCVSRFGVSAWTGVERRYIRANIHAQNYSTLVPIVKGLLSFFMDYFVMYGLL